MLTQSGSINISMYTSYVFQKPIGNKAVVRSNKPQKDANKKTVLPEISSKRMQDSGDQFSEQFDKFCDMYS